MVQRFLKKPYYLLTTLCCSGGGNAFSGEFEKKNKDQGSTFSLVQININKYIYKYILYILLIFVQFCILHSCKVCFSRGIGAAITRQYE